MSKRTAVAATVVALGTGFAACGNRTGGQSGASSDATVARVDAQSDAAVEFTCTLILGLSSTSDWIYGGDYFSLVDGTKWESITKHEEYLQDWGNPNDPVWSQAFDPADASMAHTCMKDSESPDRVIFVAFTSTADSTYNDYSNVNDPTVLANWVAGLETVVTTIQGKYPHVKRIELMTFIRGPGTSGPGMDCMPAATTDHEDMVMPWVDNAIATVAQNQPQLVTIAPKFYVGDCSWFSDVGPHFLPDGKPDLVAAEVAAYYNAHP
jgi:hypothetical protein